MTDIHEILRDFLDSMVTAKIIDDYIVTDTATDPYYVAVAPCGSSDFVYLNLRNKFQGANNNDKE